MFLKHAVLCVLWHLALNGRGLMTNSTLTSARGHQLLESVVNLTNSLVALTPYLNSSLAGFPPDCVQMLCKFVCFNGISTDIQMDISRVAQKNNYFCSRLEELRLYNYVFPEAKLYHGFLGNYSDKVEILYLASAYVTDIEAGTFTQGIFKEIYIENLQLRELRRDFFEGITHDFNSLSIIQRQMPIETIHADFLGGNVKYLIKSLTVQAGLKSVSNLTGGDLLLTNLVHADFSYNDFGRSMKNTAFNQVSMLEWLDLSSSHLEYIPSYLFVDFLTTLKYLDLSHNKLKTISRNIFGWREIPRDLKIYAADNEWSCSCALQRELRFIIIHYKAPLVCSEPAVYRGLMVTDEQICGTAVESFASSTAKSSEVESHTITSTKEEHVNHYTTDQTTEPQLNATSSGPNTSDYFMKLGCLAKLVNHVEELVHFLPWPHIMFDLKLRENLHVDIIVDSSDKPYADFGLIWFSQGSSKYYEMAIDSTKYDLESYKNISFITSVKDLAPNTAYIFCLVSTNGRTVSPFSCKSMQVNNDLAIQNSDWITQDMSIIGFVLFILGIVLFLLAGFLTIYLLLKRKIAFLTARRRESALKTTNEKFIRSIKGCRGALAINRQRRKSNDSTNSYDSYINANVYEVIPALENLNTKTSKSFVTCPDSHDTDSYYLTPWETMPFAKNQIQYAQIPCQKKRNTNDELPQLPTEAQKSQNDPDYARIGNLYFLDSHV